MTTWSDKSSFQAHGGHRMHHCWSWRIRWRWGGVLDVTLQDSGAWAGLVRSHRCVRVARASMDVLSLPAVSNLGWYGDSKLSDELPAHVCQALHKGAWSLGITIDSIITLDSSGLQPWLMHSLRVRCLFRSILGSFHFISLFRKNLNYTDVDSRLLIRKCVLNHSRVPSTPPSIPPISMVRYDTHPKSIFPRIFRWGIQIKYKGWY